MSTAQEIADLLRLDLFDSVYAPRSILYIFDDCACAQRREEVIKTVWKYTGELKASFETNARPTTVPAGAKIALPIQIPFGTLQNAPPPPDFDALVTKILRDNPALTGIPAPPSVSRAWSSGPKLPGLKDWMPDLARPAGIESELARQLRAMPRCYVCDKPGATPRLKERGTPLCDGCADQTPEPKATP